MGRPTDIPLMQRMYLYPFFRTLAKNSSEEVTMKFVSNSHRNPKNESNFQFSKLNFCDIYFYV